MAGNNCTAARSAPPQARFVLLGSTRKFTRWPDDHGNGVLAGEAAFLGSGRPGVMLHPTMIYGAQGEDNVQRLAALLRRLPVLPLPQAAGEAYGSVRADLERRREVIGNNDLWIAAHALAAGLTLATNNRREFTRIDGLQLADWVRAS